MQTLKDSYSPDRPKIDRGDVERLPALRPGFCDQCGEALPKSARSQGARCKALSTRPPVAAVSRAQRIPRRRPHGVNGSADRRLAEIRSRGKPMMQGTMTKPTIATASGQYFNFLQPDPLLINIRDISVGLSNTCRFGGQCKRFYSVAEHCVLMSYIVPDNMALIALMHDAAEAFTGDIPKPLKQLLPDFAVIEERVEFAVAQAFGIPLTLPPEVKTADRQMLCAEQVQVMGNSDQWVHTQETSPADVVVQFWTPVRAERAFIDRYTELTARG